ncbi:Glycosyl transferase family 2 [Lachnospiraceae bacterium]|nr:Glycosyl transferase family 2 [Lachnospiraceae bacterium]
MDSKISIIIPAYNIAGFIGRSIECALGQDVPKEALEVIVVDDGSTDGTGAIADQYSEKDSRVRVIHKENGGVSAARNDGIAAAKGEFIFFFDGDDFEESYTCSEVAKMAEEQAADAVIYGYSRYEDDKVKEVCHPHFSESLYIGQDIVKKVVPAFIGLSNRDINNWLRGEKDALYVENPALWRILVRRSVILQNNLKFDTTLKVGEDTVFISDYLSCCKRVAVTDKCYYYLVTRSTSAIYRYEREPFSKLDGKKKLNDAREALTERIIKRTGIDVTEYYAGTIVMSAVEMAFKLSAKGDKSRKERYKAYRSYTDDPRVVRAVKNFRPGRGSLVKRVPFMMMKSGAYGLLFFATSLLNAVHYEFKR